MRASTICISLWLVTALAVPAEVLARPRPIKPAMTFVSKNRSAVCSAARKAGGMLELHRGSRYRLLVTDSGGFAYQRINRSSARVHKVHLNLLFPHGKFPGLSSDALLTKLQGAIQPGAQASVAASNTRRPATSKLQQAILPDGTKVAPSSQGGGYHGTNTIDPRAALKHGLPARGNDWRLKEHSEQNGSSAFRGTTAVVSEPVSGNGAAYWAGEGGWVFEIRKIPSWDVNTLLEGRVQTLSGFRGNLMHGENETAIPARVAPVNIKAYGKVVSENGKLKVKDWIQNPGFVDAQPPPHSTSRP